MFRRFSLLVAAVGIGAALPAAGAWAYTNTSSPATMAVTATVLSYCSIAANNMAFGTYSPAAAAALTATTTLAVTCTNTTPYSVSLSAGNSNSVAQRTMSTGSGGPTLNYNLYQSNTYATVWGNTSSNWVTPSGGGTGTAQSLTVYGSIPAGQNATPGSYTDTITATVNY